MVKKIGILGSSGSIGQKALNVALHLGDDFQVTALAAHSNIDLVEKQARAHRPEIIGIFDKDKALELQKRLPNIPVLGGEEGVVAVATHSSVDLLLSAITGFGGILPTIRAIESGKDIALANKEVLVAAGELVMQLVEKHGVSLIPVDSEHTAIFQCLNGEKLSEVHRIILTASGGPFREYSQEMLQKIDVQQALTHPNYKMGSKVTIDSSTLMNKGLEMIEAHYLYNIPTNKIDVVVHKEQIIHSFVEFVDGSIMAQLSEPDMCIPIQYAMTYPERKKSMLPPFDFTKHPTLSFSEPDFDKFRCLRLAYDSLQNGGSMPCYMNAANEILVERFLKQEISWVEISQKLENLMEKHETEKVASLDQLLGIDKQARMVALTI